MIVKVKIKEMLGHDNYVGTYRDKEIDTEFIDRTHGGPYNIFRYAMKDYGDLRNKSFLMKYGCLDRIEKYDQYMTVVIRTDNDGEICGCYDVRRTY